MINFIKNLGNTLAGRYHYHPEAVIIACYYNSQDNPYRKIAFDLWYDSIKHLNHRIIECTINGSEPQLPKSEFIKVIDSSSMLWHKESLLNLIVSELPKKFKYVFWLDTDVLFTNKKWLTKSVKVLEYDKLMQPFEFCAHLEQDETKFNGPNSVSDTARNIVGQLKLGEKVDDIKCWRSFCANNASHQSSHNHYDIHGHVGFAWGARREVLDAVPLYDKALIGGADHIIAHAGAGHINHSCIAKSFTDNIDEVNEWSNRFFGAVRNKIGYVEGDLLHIWHGDIKKREYYQRIKEFTPMTKKIQKKDENGLYVTDDDSYVTEYFNRREAKSENYPEIDLSYKDLYPEIQRKHNIIPEQIANNSKFSTHQLENDKYLQRKRRELQQSYPDADDSFIESLLIGYITDNGMLGAAVGGNLLGGIIGDMLNDNDSNPEPTSFNDGFGGGDFSGGGASGSWPETNNDNNNYEGSTFS